MAALFQSDIDLLLAEIIFQRIETLHIQRAEITGALQDRGKDRIAVRLDVRLLTIRSMNNTERYWRESPHIRAHRTHRTLSATEKKYP